MYKLYEMPVQDFIGLFDLLFAWIAPNNFNARPSLLGSPLSAYVHVEIFYKSHPELSRVADFPYDSYKQLLSKLELTGENIPRLNSDKFYQDLLLRKSAVREEWREAELKFFLDTYKEFVTDKSLQYVNFDIKSKRIALAIKEQC